MEHKDWDRLEELFHAAFGLSADERAVYLDQACPQDALLRAEVESLIAAVENKSGFMEDPALSLGMKVMAEGSTEDSLIGKLIGPHRIISLLGKGGMGEVYLAEDTRLGRKVAIKFLSSKFVDDAWAKRQLMREAQAVAKLDHPNICAVHGFETDNDYSFIVMQHIEGETLASLIRKGALRPEQIHGLALQIVSALAEAHAHGIIHRDIKPQNIIVTASGQVKVLDFGLAKLVQQRQSTISTAQTESQDSQLGLVIGTVAYMSPEQLRGERLDFRTDLFSFGIVLHEMLSGTNPYSRGSNAEIISAILSGEPQPITNLATGTLANLAGIAQRCLKRDREQRYQSASEILLDLNNPPKSAAPRTKLPAYLRLRAHVALALLLLLIIGAAIIYSRLNRVQTLAVLPIINETADANTEYLSDGLTESLINKLARLSGLRVKAPTIVSVYKGQKVDPQQAGRELNADALLMGTILQRDDLLILQARLVDAGDGSEIWVDDYIVKPTEMIALQEELSVKIASGLKLSLSGEEKRLLSKHQTDNPEAFKRYLLGRYYWSKRNPENIEKAIGFFEQAIDLDPLYAQAYAGLADSCVVQSTVAYGPLKTREAMSKAKWAANKAIEIDESLCEAHTSLGIVKLKFEWNWQEAEKEFKRAISLNPDYAPAHYWYSTLLALTGNSAGSVAESEKAREMDPFSPLSESNLGRAFYYARQYDRAADHFGKMLGKDPNDPRALYMLGLIYLQKGLIKESIDSLQKLNSLNKLLAAAPLGHAYARAGRKAEALKILEELEELSNQKHIPPQEKAIIYMGLDNKDQAFIFLQKACEDRFPSLPFIKIDPLFDSIRFDPRFADLARCANINF